jgi:2-oxoglutarate ferredoxin oxidoreductase subunit delta
LCVVVCPKDCIDISEQSNKHGYFPAQANNTDCTGCAMCAIICPDAVIEVQRDSNITSIDSGNKDRLSLTKEKT